jgi:hypothetical protein
MLRGARAQHHMWIKGLTQMNSIPSKVGVRLATGIKKFQPILAAQQSRDVNEADTSVLVTEILSELFGYDKFTEITSEHEVHNAYCDKAVRVDGQIMLLVEVKAIGSELKDAQVRQATDYAAKQGVDWVVLTNAAIWRVYKMLFGKPVEFELVYEFKFADLNPRSEQDLERLSLLSRESWHKNKLVEYQTKMQVLGKFSLAAVILSEPVLKVIRSTLHRGSPGIKVSISQIAEALQSEVLKREVLEGEKADAARKMLKKLDYRAGKSHQRANAARGESERGQDRPLGDGSDSPGLDVPHS